MDRASSDRPKMEHGLATLAVVIVNYRTPQLVIDCLNSFHESLDECARVVVVDNASEDNSIGLLRQWASACDRKWLVSLIESPKNNGFSAGNNLGIRSIDAEFYLLLNSDTIVRPGAIGELIETARSNPRAGVVSPRLEWPDGTPQHSCFRDHSPISEFINAAATGPITRALKKFDVPMAQSSDLLRPHWTSFACVLLRRRMLEQIDLLDEAFFMYYEDAELCRRARDARWEVLHNPAAKVVHLRGGTSPVKRLAQQHERLPRYFYASRSRYFMSVYGRSGLILANMLWFFGRAISKTRELVRGDPPQVPARQWLDIWTNCVARDFPQPSAHKWLSPISSS